MSFEFALVKNLSALICELSVTISGPYFCKRGKTDILGYVVSYVICWYNVLFRC